MIIKNFNGGLLITSRVLNVLLILYIAVMMAKFIWWIFSPSSPEVYVEKTSVKQFDNSTKNVINRYPFGVIVVQKKAEVVAVITDDIKLTGVYLNTKANTIAFIELNKKPMIAKVGDTVGNGVVIKVINPDSIVVIQNDNEVTLKLAGGTAQPSSTGSAGVSSYIPGNSRANDSYQAPTANPSQMNSPSDYNSNSSDQSGSVNDEFKERRKKLIEEFSRRNGSQESNN